MKLKRAAINKITPPDLPEIVLRERLFDLLDRKQRGVITWVTGSAGSGKTTLTASYLRTRNIPCLWYRLDERDFDVSTFFYYLGQAAIKALPRMRKTLPLLTLEYKENTAGFARVYFEGLSSRMRPPFGMVFDNFESVAHADQFMPVFKKALGAVSEEIHVFVLSRREPPAIFSGMLANSRMWVVGQKDLGLSLEETALFLERGTGERVDREVVRRLHRKTMGWAAGLVLTANAVHRGVPLEECLQEGVPAAVGDYFSSEIFGGLADHLRAFLMRLAFLPAATAAAAREITGDPRAGKILATLHRDHLFVERFSSSAYTYRLHPMFRAFLLAEALDNLEAEEIRRAWRCAAGILESVGQAEDALECFARLPDADQIARLIQTHAVELVRQGRLDTLSAWLAKIPETMLAENPWLLFWMGMRYRPGRAASARPWFERAFARFQENGDVVGSYLAWSRIIDSIILAWDDFTLLDAWIDGFDKAAYLNSMPPVADIQARVSVSMCGALIIRRPHHPDLAFWLESALALCRDIRDTTTQLKTCIWSATYHMWTGNFERADLDREIAQKMIRRNALSPVIRQFWVWLDVSADIRTMTAPGKALNRILGLLQEADKSGQHFGDHMFFPPGMLAATVLGDFDKAKRLLKRFRENTDDSRKQGLVIYYHFQALYSLLRGRLKRAAVYAENALDTARQTGYVFYEALCLLQMAHVTHLQGQNRSARATLKKAEAISDKTGSDIFRCMCLLKKAHLELDEGYRDEGLDCLGRALALGRCNDYVTLAWWWDPTMLARLCAEALCAGIEGDYVRRFVRLHHLRPVPPFLYLERWPWPVRIYTFERFQVLLEGEVLAFGKRAPKKTLELLQALIAFGGVEVPVDRILDALWFDADGDMAQSAFSTALNRLRKLLQAKQSIVMSSGRISLNQERCWVDCLAFQHAISEGDAHWDRKEKEAALVCYRQAFSLYRGAFLLSENPAPWIISTRERFKIRFLAAIQRMGRQLEEAQHVDAAMACYLEGLSVDDLEEALYQRLMTLQLHLGRSSEAVRTYHRCRERLAGVLGVAPSPATEALFRRTGGKGVK